MRSLMEYVSMVLEQTMGSIWVTCSLLQKKKISETINSLVLWARQCPLVFLVLLYVWPGILLWFLLLW